MFPYWYPRADTNGVSYGPWSLAILNLQAQAIANFLGQLQVARETGSSLQCSAYYFQFHLLKSAGIGPLSRAIHMVVGFIRSTFILRERCVVTPQGRSDSQCRLDYKKLSTQHGLFHICYSIRAHTRDIQWMGAGKGEGEEGLKKTRTLWFELSTNQ